MKTTKTQKPAPAPSLGFRFTPAQEQAIERAKRRARKYMRSYGKGSRPGLPPLLDIRGYSISNPELFRNATFR